ncbi:MAG: hypothetical protein QXI32_04280 [Candidatus Bathyarchaeia archaeon]
MAVLVLFTVRDLEDKMGGVNIRLRAISKNEPRIVKTKDGKEHVVVDVRAADRTGEVELSLWDERIRDVDIGDVIDIENAYVNRFKGRLRLNIGRFGRLEKVEDPGFPQIEELTLISRGKYALRGSSPRKVRR